MTKKEKKYDDFTVVWRKSKVLERKLGRSGAVGICYFDDTVAVDPRLDSKEYLITSIHEQIHHHFPDLEEEIVDQISTHIGGNLWKSNYRKIQK